MAAGLSQTQLANLSDVNRTDEVDARLAKALSCKSRISERRTQSEP